MRRFLHIGMGAYQIFPKRDLRPGETPRPFVDDLSALNFLYRLVGIGPNQQALRLTLRTEVLGTHLTGFLPNADLCRLLARELVQGRIKVVAFDTSWGRAAAKTYKQETEEPEEAATSRAPASEDLHWIAIQVVDDETGAPLSGVPLEIELPDGRTLLRRTGGDGTLHFSDLDAGTCSILKMLDKDALEVMAVE